jgi:hypothetical protein
MKTLTLLFSILVAQVLGRASFGQNEPPVNAVGYLNVTVKPGYSMISNPLVATDNSVGALFRNFQGGAPDGTTIYKLVNGNFVVASWVESENRFIPEEAANMTLVPGEGVFIFLAGAVDRVLTFVGAIPNGELCVHIPTGFSIVSAPGPFTMNPAQTLFVFPPTPPRSLTMYRYSPTLRNYTAYTYFGDLFTEWSPALPTLPVGEAVWVYNVGPAFDSCNTYRLNTPQ